MMQEVWRPVVGWEEQYEVSSLGRVKSLARRYWTTGGRTPRWCQLRSRILKPGLNPNGYEFVVLCVGGKKRVRVVHQLVAEAFIGPRPEGQDTRHGPLGRRVNTPSNLSYGTRAENMQDRHRDGTHHRGEMVNGAKLTWVQVQEIRAMKGEHTQQAIADRYGIARSNVSLIHNGKVWAEP